MQILQSSHLFTFPKPLNPNRPLLHNNNNNRRHVTFPAAATTKSFPPKCFSSDEFPVDETFLEQFGPKDKETEDEARRRNWIERGWAPWEEILTPEADFARKSLNEGEEVALQSPEAVEAFKMLKPSYRMKKIKEMGITEDEWYKKQFEIKGEIPEKLETVWAAPLLVTHVAPRDWPPRGWEVDRKELEYIREAHKLQNVRVEIGELERKAKFEREGFNFDMYRVFLKQYNQWVAANKDRLEEESYKYDQDYYPGRRKRGKDYEEGMYELPFYYPGQICEGKVTTVHLYQGAFVDIGGVYDGWVPIKGNDWYWIRHHIKVGMHVIVEILAFRVHRFNRFDFAPIFHRDEDKNPDELRRDCGRPPVPRKYPGVKPEEEGLLSTHPYVDKLWQIHNAEQLILDDMEANPDKYKGKKLSELTDDEEFDDENSVEYTKVNYKKALLAKIILKTSVKELDLEAALAEREALGLPLEEPGRYKEDSFFGKDEYDPSNPLYRYDYWGEPKNSEKSLQERMRDAHNKSIVGKGMVWYEMSYDDVIKQKMQREARSKCVTPEEVEEEDSTSGHGNGDDDDDGDFDYSILSDSSSLSFSNQPVVNGTESSSISDEGMFED
ncbi:protein PLASTID TRANSCRIPTIONALLY ACTIVE 10 [Citrus sinensis]|uniref:Protein PLASTID TRANSCRIPTIONALLY ACTIVE 10 n=1 Tax=Citrus sinensis TaxID=2711 RepID=A0ACB8LTU1_CITSI|nr:protein PLASTID TRANSCRIPTIONALLY ACTIVE 10 [Citrus sinensis]